MKSQCSAYYRTQQMEMDYIGHPKLSYTRRSRQQSIRVMQSQINTKSNGLFLPPTKLSTRNGSLSMKLFQMHNTVNCSVQQVCLDNKKWLIIDQDPSFGFRNMSNMNNMPSLLKNKKSGKKAVKTSQKYFKQTLLTKKQKLCNNQNITVRNDIKKSQKKMNVSIGDISNKNLKEYYKNHRLYCKRNDECKSNQQKIFKRICQLKQCVDKTQVRLENSGSKSNKSKTNKTNKSDKTNKTSKVRKINKINEINASLENNQDVQAVNGIQPLHIELIDEKVIEEKVKQQMSLYERKQKMEDKASLLVIAKLYDPIELLNCNIFSKKLTSNYYQLYPEWQQKSFQNVHHQQDQEQALLQDDQIPSEHQKGNMQSCPCLEDLPLQKSIHLQNSLSLQNLILQPVDDIVQDTNHTNLIKIQQQKIESGQLNEQEQIQKAEKQRSLTTKGTDNCNSTLVHVQRQLPMDMNVLFVDKDYCLDKQFKAQPLIRLINIHPNRQTALFPIDPKNHLIIASAKQSPFYGQYSNIQLINFLNFILLINPKLIELVFQPPTDKGYNCLIHNGSTVQKITVDGYFPFDLNYYPLFGRVEQYIWLSVLLKCIAKLKGSYKYISPLTFHEMYFLLTGENLKNITKQLVELQNPIKILIVLQRQGYKNNKCVMFNYQDSFFKLEKIIVNQNNKKQTQQELQFRQLPSKKLKKKRSSSNGQGENYKFLNIFLQQKKEQIAFRETKENTVLKLRGRNGIKLVNWKQIMTGSYQIYVAKPSFQTIESIDLVNQ